MIKSRIRLLYFKNVIDRCMRRFFNDFSEDFSRDHNGRYVYSKHFSADALQRYFEKIMACEITQHVQKFDVIEPEYLFLIGGCHPQRNILVDYCKTDFPTKLKKYVESDKCFKYVLKEKDIDIDMAFFNSIFDLIFEKIFAKNDGIKALIGSDYPNVFAIYNKRLDCYAVFKSIKRTFGDCNCVNVFVEDFKDDIPCISAVNDIIRKYSMRKRIVEKSNEFILIDKELRQYAEELIKNTYGR